MHGFTFKFGNGLLYGPEYDLSWQMFQMPLKVMCIQPLLDEVFSKWQISQAGW